MTAQPYIECSLCDEAKPIHRKLTLTNDDGLVIDTARFCRDCWNNIRQSVEDASGLIDRRQEN
ncbi:MAG TPA: hypothetical protein VNO52_16650 [Methylomirabilota bacterium]|nr:hypothetical protein [Methylomirabilota bacterium]